MSEHVTYIDFFGDQPFCDTDNIYGNGGAKIHRFNMRLVCVGSNWERLCLVVLRNLWLIAVWSVMLFFKMAATTFTRFDFCLFGFSLFNAACCK